MWKTLDQPVKEGFKCYMVEHQGEIFSFCCPKDSSRPKFFCINRYNGGSNAWERLSNNDVKLIDTSWFLSDFQTSFSSKGQGFKVCSFNRLRHLWSAFVRRDMMHETSRRRLLVFPYLLRGSPCWVNLD